MNLNCVYNLRQFPAPSKAQKISPAVQQSEVSQGQESQRMEAARETRETRAESEDEDVPSDDSIEDLIKSSSDSGKLWSQ